MSIMIKEGASHQSRWRWMKFCTGVILLLAVLIKAAFVASDKEAESFCPCLSGECSGLNNPVSPMHKLRSQYENEGFARLSRDTWITTEDWEKFHADVLSASDQYTNGSRAYHIFMEKDSSSNADRLSRIENWLGDHSFPAKLCREQMEPLVHMAFGEPGVLFKDKINMKSSGADGYGAHQDSTGGNWMAAASRHLNVLIPLDPMTSHNGPLEVASGGWHKFGQLGKTYHGLNKTFEEKLAWHEVILQPGELFFFDGFAPHRSKTNPSPDPRRVIYLTYNPAKEGDHHDAYYGGSAKFRASPCDDEAGPNCRSFLPSQHRADIDRI